MCSLQALAPQILHVTIEVPVWVSEGICERLMVLVILWRHQRISGGLDGPLVAFVSLWRHWRAHLGIGESLEGASGECCDRGVTEYGTNSDLEAYVDLQRKL